MSKQSILGIILLIFAGLSFFFLKLEADQAKEWSDNSCTLINKMTSQNPNWSEDYQSDIFIEISDRLDAAESLDNKALVLNICTYLIPALILGGGLFYLYHRKNDD